MSTGKIISFFPKHREELTEEQLEENKKSILFMLDSLREKVVAGEVMSITMTAQFYTGCTGNAYHLPSFPITMLGEIETLKARILQNEVDISP